MLRRPPLFAVLGLAASLLAGTAGAQARFYGPPQRGGPGGPPGGAFQGPPQGGGGGYGREGFARPDPYRPEPYRADAYRRAPLPDRREPGWGEFGYPAAPYTPPHYPSPPPRRTASGPPVWGEAPRSGPSYAMPAHVALGEVITSLRRIAPGRLLDAAQEDLDGRTVYRVRWMTRRGRRMDYVVDAASGAILSGR